MVEGPNNNELTQAGKKKKKKSNSNSTNPQMKWPALK